MSDEQDFMAAAIEARQRANECNQDNDPGEWGLPCCPGCVCFQEAEAALKEHGNA